MAGIARHPSRRGVESLLIYDGYRAVPVGAGNCETQLEIMISFSNNSRRTCSLTLLLAFLFSVDGAFARKQPPSKPIDLNVANAKELQGLPGIGAVTAQRIIEMRQKSGRFKRVEDLLAIRGISQKKLDALRPYVTIGPPPAVPIVQKTSPTAKKTP
jgi:competence ComEA-like helix-hairpin-helix protein